jgi:hypothetical protein
MTSDDDSRRVGTTLHPSRITAASPVRPLRAFIETCLDLATRELDDVMFVAPTLYTREGNAWGTLIAPRNGTRVLADEQAAMLEEALRDIAIDPDIDAYCALFYAGVARPGMSVAYGLRVHIGDRASATGLMRFYPVVSQNGLLVVQDFLFSRVEPSWFQSVVPIVESSSRLPSDVV